MKGFIIEYICGLMRIYKVCGDKDQRALDLFHDICYLDPVTSSHCS